MDESKQSSRFKEEKVVNGRVKLKRSLLRRSILLIFIVLFFNVAHSLAAEGSIKVKLTVGSNVVQQDGVISLRVTVKNVSNGNVYLVVGEKARPAYDLSKREIGFGLDIQPTNFHYFEFPKLKKIRPNSSVTTKVKIPVSSLNRIDLGCWTMNAYVGVLNGDKLDNKLKQLGFSINDNVQMSATEFVELQDTYYSNDIQICVVNK